MNVKTFWWVMIVVLSLILLQWLLPNSHCNLACGLFAFIGSNPADYFSWDKFNILGWFNDDRGGDACGRCFGNVIEHGVDKLEDYKDFAIAIKNPTTPMIYNTILGHCRKASSGGRVSMYAQPIVIQKRDVNMKAIKDKEVKRAIKALKPDDIVFSGIHNGTIDNYKELAPKYGIPIDDHNDSKVLLTALFYDNLSILSEYQGTAAIIWHNHITNTTSVFRGISKMYDTSHVDSDERPLFFWNIGKGNFYISSIKDSLMFIGAVEADVRDVAANKVQTFINGVTDAITVVDRSKCTQAKTTYYNSKNSKDWYNNGKWVAGRWVPEKEKDIVWNGNKVNHMDAYYDEDGALVYDSTPPSKSLCLPLKLEKDASTITQEELAFSKNKDGYIREFDIDGAIRLQAEKLDFGSIRLVKRALFNKGRYWMQGGLMHGTYILNTIGMIPGIYSRDTTVLKPYYFIEGVMMDGITGYQKALELHKEFKKAVIRETDKLCDLERDFTSDIVKYSRQPTVSLTKTFGEQDCYKSMNKRADENGNDFFTGTFLPLFSSRRYVFSQGDLIAIIEDRTRYKEATHDTDDQLITDTYIVDNRKSLLKDAPLYDAMPAEFRIGYHLLLVDNAVNPLSPLQNLMFSTCGLYDQKDIALMLVHYMRDFFIDVKESCITCVDAREVDVEKCIRCKHCKEGISKLLESVNYDVYK